VEDDGDVSRFIALHLLANDHNPLLAMDGVAAIKETNQNQPDLILLDLGLPRIDGFVVLECLDPFVALAPIIVVSGADPEKNEAKALRAGATATCKNPWTWRTCFR
jgi:DNA-binding response OmpR family regulator